MKATTQTKPCEHCGKPVTKTGRQAAQRKYWTCGRTCSGLLRIRRGDVAAGWQPNRFRGVRETRACDACGTPITRYVTEANHDKPWRCSRACAATVRAGQPRRRHGDTVSCVTCGKEFYRLPKQIRSGRKYCSRDCASVGIQADLTRKPCGHCGTPMVLRPSEMGKQFCSWECHLAAKYKHALDRMHNGKPARLTHEGYVKVWEPEHPSAVAGWVLEHRLVMEKHLGRLLTPAEEVDHVDSDPAARSDNRLENLQVLSRGAHRKKTGADARQRRMTMRDELAAYRERFGPLP
jgi:endogenous inhibitor of DNA gyrase (YacG/DUF329 family)